MHIARRLLGLALIALINSCSEGADPLSLILVTPTPIVVTREVQYTLVAPRTSTPIPTPTFPAYLGSPIAVDPDFEDAVQASLVALGDGFTVKLFAKDSEGDTIVWLQDRQYPDTLVCSAPFHAKNLGSVMILTTSNLYGKFKAEGLVQGQRGCIAVKLDQGSEPIEKLLMDLHAIYAARVKGERFSTASDLNRYIDAFLAQHQDQSFKILRLYAVTVKVIAVVAVVIGLVVDGLAYAGWQLMVDAYAALSKAWPTIRPMLRSDLNAPLDLEALPGWPIWIVMALISIGVVFVALSFWSVGEWIELTLDLTRGKAATVEIREQAVSIGHSPGSRESSAGVP
jgi:hypothetical protein